MRQQGAKKCFSCGHPFDDEANLTESPYVLQNPRVKEFYRARSKIGRFLETLTSFHSILLILSIVLVAISIYTFLPYIIGVQVEGQIVEFEALHCRGDCQYRVTYEFIDNRGNVRTGEYHWSYADYEYTPPKEGQPTILRYVPWMPWLPAVAVEGWFPWGWIVLGVGGILLIVAVRRNWL